MSENTKKPIDDTVSKIEVENMILQTKVDIAKEKIHWILFFFVLLGIVYPIVNTFYQGNQVDKKLEYIETRFKELAGKQLRKPKIVCKIDNEPLLDNVLLITQSDGAHIDYIDVYNEGDGVSGPINAYLYFNELPEKTYVNYHDLIWYNFDWVELPSENKKYRYKNAIGKKNHLSPKDIFNIGISFVNQSEKEMVDFKAMLKIYYGESKPVEVPFTVRVPKQSPAI